MVLVLAVMMGVLLLAAPMFSQTSTGRLSGTVKDQTGGAIVGAAVVVTDVARGLARNLTTDEAGAFLAPNLIAGQYTVRATYTGFQAWVRENITLGVGGDVAIDAVLLPGAQTQTVTITEELPLINTTSSALSATLTSQTIADLPVSGRNYAALLDLKPGTVTQLGNENGGGGTTSVNGLRGELSQETLVEGLHGLGPEGEVANSPFLRGDSSTMLPSDAIQEFTQQTNTKAENSFRAGGTVNIGIKSGTNAMHGSVFGYFRDAATDAKNYFNTPTTPVINGNMQQMGGTIGGPIMRDKLFYFLAYENQRYHHGQPNTTNVAFTDPALIANYPACLTAGAGGTSNCAAIPFSVGPGAVGDPNNRTPNASQHLLLACAALKNAGLARSPQSLSLVSLNADCTLNGSNYPFGVGTAASAAVFPNGVPFLVPHGNDHGVPSATSGQGINTYYSNAQVTNSSHNAVAKVDYTLNEKNVINVFLFMANGLLIGDSSKTDPVWYSRVRVRPMQLAGTWTWLPNSSWANSLRFGYAQENRYFRGVDQIIGLTAADLGLPTGVSLDTAVDGAVENGGYPQVFQWAGFQSAGSRNSEPRGPRRTPEISDQINYLRGNHSMRFGASMFGQVQDGGTWADTRGRFVFGRTASDTAAASGLVAFLRGQGSVPSSVDSDGAGGTPAVAIRSATTGLESSRLFYGNPDSHMRSTLYSIFIQDDWRIRPRLTLNLGVRYDIGTVPHDQDYILGSFDPIQGIVQEGIHIPAVHKGDHNNISPRVGFAWDMRGNGKTVLRAGGSMIYSPVELGVFAEIGNAPGLAGTQTHWVIGCIGALTHTAVISGAQPVMPAGQQTNCAAGPNGLIRPGGNRDVGVVSWSRGDENIVGTVNWDAASTGGVIWPGKSVLNCSPSILVKDNINDTPLNLSPSRRGAGCDIVAVDRDLRTPYVQTWTLSLQHAILNNLVLDIAYVGNHGTLLTGRLDANQPQFGSGWTPALIAACIASPISDNCNGDSGTSNNLSNDSKPFSGRQLTTASFSKPFPYLNVITRTGNFHTSNYNALQTTLTARNFHGLSSTFGYTWGKALEIASDNTGTTDAQFISNEYGPGRNDLRHRFTVTSVYQVPGRMGFGGLLEGWRLNGVVRYQTGPTWNGAATNDSAGNNRNSRWDFSGDPSDFVTDYTGVNKALFHPNGPTATGTNPQTASPYVAADLAINTSLCTAAAGGSANKLATLQAFGCWTQGGSAITPPAVGTYGNMGKGIFTGPSYFNIDFSVTKRQQITEAYTVEFRVESFNILNHPPFSGPGTGLGCTSGGCSLGQTSSTPNVDATNPFLGSGGPRRFQFGAKFIF